MSTPYHNRESFARAIDRLIEQTARQGRWEDLQRVVRHLDSAPEQLSSLASLMLLVDEDWRLLLKAEIEAFQRWGRQKGQDLSDDEILVVMRDCYDAACRAGKSDE